MVQPARSALPAGPLPFLIAGVVVVSSLLALRHGRRTAVPRDEPTARAVAASLGLPIPDACVPGVMGNLALLDRHAATFRDAGR
jgi:sodium/bile acid cotransporter 7